MDIHVDTIMDTHNCIMHFYGYPSFKHVYPNGFNMDIHNSVMDIINSIKC